MKERLRTLSEEKKKLIKERKEILLLVKKLLDEKNQFNNPLHFVEALLEAIEEKRVTHKVNIMFSSYFPSLERGYDYLSGVIDIFVMRKLSIKEFVTKVANPEEYLIKFNTFLQNSSFEVKSLDKPSDMINRLLASKIYQGGSINLDDNLLNFSALPHGKKQYVNFLFKMEDVMRDKYLPVHYQNLEYEGKEQRKWKRTGF